MNEVIEMENSNQKFYLKWNNFPNSFLSQFTALKEEEDFVDVTLYCCGQCIKAHKVILSACSPYLKNIFKEHPCKHPIIILDNLSFNNLEAVIQFVYTGQVYIHETELSSFLKAAKILQIRGLTESNTQTTIDVDPLPVSESSNHTVTNKQEFNVEIESKRIKGKKSFRRVPNCNAKENNEIVETKQNKEKDCYEKSKFEENSEDSSLQINSVEQNFESNDSILNTSVGEDEFSSEEFKRPRWLDPRSCPLCNRTYSNLSNLRQHMKLIHNPTFVTCKLCNKTFKTDLYLRRHISSYHEFSGNGNSNMSSPSSMETSLKSVHGHSSDWNVPSVKLEPDAFQEMFNSNEMYQVQ